MLSSLPSFVSQKRMARSSPPVAQTVPSGLKAAQVIGPLCRSASLIGGAGAGRFAAGRGRRGQHVVEVDQAADAVAVAGQGQVLGRRRAGAGHGRDADVVVQQADLRLLGRAVPEAQRAVLAARQDQLLAVCARPAHRHASHLALMADEHGQRRLRPRRLDDHRHSDAQRLGVLHVGQTLHAQLERVLDLHHRIEVLHRLALMAVDHLDDAGDRGADLVQLEEADRGASTPALATWRAASLDCSSSM